MKARINGGLTYTDDFGQKVSSEGNYKINISTEPGQAQVQKTNIMYPIQPDKKITITPSSAKVVFVLDVSGSMGGMIDTVKSNIESFYNGVKAAGVNDVEIGICTYGTYDLDDPNFVTCNYADGSLWSSDIEEIKTVLAPITAPYTWDTYNYYAVQKAAETG